MSRYRNICVTINNWVDDDIARIKDLDTRYFVIGKEKGESGTPHLQCYIELNKQYRHKALVTAFAGRAHFEKRKGTPEQAADYCKKDGDYFEEGEMSHPGYRSDIVAFRDAVKRKATDAELLELFPTDCAKYPKFINFTRQAYAQEDKSFLQPEVIVLWGPAGSGKTSQAYAADPNLYCVTDARWFDGYIGQETILIDDFYGGIKYTWLLRLLDGYRFNLPIKGGFTWKSWKRVYITSNNPPETWYFQGLTPALQRRITSIIKVEGRGIVLPATSETA